MPDGIAFGDSGLLYVAIATPGASGISALNPDGVEKFRLTNPVLTPDSTLRLSTQHRVQRQGVNSRANHAFRHRQISTPANSACSRSTSAAPARPS